MGLFLLPFEVFFTEFRAWLILLRKIRGPLAVAKTSISFANPVENLYLAANPFSKVAASLAIMNVLEDRRDSSAIGLLRALASPLE
jgi:hypothetical protein